MVHLFNCGIFNDAASSLDYRVLNDRMIKELERICKETIAHAVLSLHFRGGTEEYHKPQ
jgi:hypothetical protein